MVVVGCGELSPRGVGACETRGQYMRRLKEADGATHNVIERHAALILPPRRDKELCYHLVFFLLVRTVVTFTFILFRIAAVVPWEMLCLRARQSECFFESRRKHELDIFVRVSHGNRKRWDAIVELAGVQCRRVE